MHAVNPYIRSIAKNELIEAYFGSGDDLPVELWSAERMKKFQWEAIGQLVTHAVRSNEHYRRQYARLGEGGLRDWDEFRTLPFLEKDALRRRPYRTLCTTRDNIAQVHISTGTTSQSQGDHLYSLLSWEDIFVNEVAMRCPLMMPHHPGDVVVVALPYEMSSAGMSMHRAYQNTMNAVVVNVGKGGFYSDPSKTVAAMKALGTNILCTTAPYALRLAEVAESMGIDPRKDMSVKLIWLGGEGFSDPFRDRIQSVWGATCLGYYSSLECGPMGIQCVAQDGFHIPEGYCYVEVIDPKTGAVLPDGEVGEVCVTNLYRFAMPFIRYRTGDIGWIDRSPCPCCSERPRVLLNGRARDQLDVGGQRVSPFEIECSLYRLAEMGNNYYIEDRGGRLVVHVETRAGHSPETLQAAAMEVLGPLGVESVQCHPRLERSLGKVCRVKRTAGP